MHLREPWFARPRYVRSVMEYASLGLISAPATTLQLLDRIQDNALHIIGVDEVEARNKLNIPFQQGCCCCCPLQHANQPLSCLSERHALRPPPPPPPYKWDERLTSSLLMPSHALGEPTSRTNLSGRSFYMMQSQSGTVYQKISLAWLVTGEPSHSRFECTNTCCIWTRVNYSSSISILAAVNPWLGHKAAVHSAYWLYMNLIYL